MKALILLTALALIPSGVPGAAKNDDRKSLRLSATLISVKDYCRSEPDLYLATLFLQLEYTNESSQTLIIQERELGNITYWRQADTPDGLAAADWGHISWVSTDSGDVLGIGGTPDGRFVTLRPGKSYRVRTEFRLVSAVAPRKSAGYIQFIVPSWSGTKQQADKACAKWKKVGWLWYENVRSQPLALALDEGAEVKVCVE